MKTLFAVILLAVSIGTSFATENQASDCPLTMHSEDRENTKASMQDKSQDQTSEQGAVSM